MKPVRLIGRIALVVLAACLLCVGVQAQELKVRADHVDAKYAAGETATFRVEVTGLMFSRMGVWRAAILKGQPLPPGK
jgi:hypothetical protein